MGTNQNEPHVPPIAIPKLKKSKGIVIISDNNFITRLWFLLSNPFRYIFTKKIRY